MKQILLLRQIFTATILLITYCANAQWVSIPDTNFGKWLNTYGYVNCLQGNSAIGWEMDTTCNKVVNDTILNMVQVSNKPLYFENLDAVKYFKKIKKFTLYYANMNKLPPMPSQLLALTLAKTKISVIDSFSPHLKYISIANNNSLKSIPAIPQSVAQLICSGKQISSVSSIPFSMKSLTILGDTVTFFPSPPSSISELSFISVLFKVAPSFPSNLMSLKVLYSNLATLVSLPNNLERLDFYGRVLPNKFPDNLIELTIGSFDSAAIPSFPKSLKTLSIVDNFDWIIVPELPDTMERFYIDHHCRIKCLPELKVIKHLKIDAHGLMCLPNDLSRVEYVEPYDLRLYPVCDVGNVHGCSFYWNVSGSVFSDANSNCKIESDETTLNGVKMSLFKSGSLQSQITTNQSGQYSFKTDLGDYEVIIDTSNLPVAISCPASGGYNISVTAIDSVKSMIDFSFDCKPGFDVGVLSAVRDSGFLFPARQGGIRIKAGDLSQFYGLNCAEGVSGAVSITYSGPVSFAGVRSGALAPVVSGNTLTYTIADFGAIDINTAFGLRFLVDTFAQIGQELCLEVVVTPTAGDNNVSNNTATYCFEIVNSYDPNMKEVSPVKAIAPDEEWLTYTIHFQNMGNAPAIHIYVMDTIDNNLDESSIQILGSSHRMLTEIKGNIARFNFPNINLVDSATNEPESKGWLQYKIKKNTNLALGTQIKNTASIYFDFNAPVVTNTVTNTVELPSSIKENRTHLSDISVFPNPTNDVVYISYSSNTSAEVTLFNINGAACLKQQLTSSNQSISLSGLPAGVYFVSVEIQGSVVRKKVVKW